MNLTRIRKYMRSALRPIGGGNSEYRQKYFIVTSPPWDAQACCSSLKIVHLIIKPYSRLVLWTGFFGPGKRGVFPYCGKSAFPFGTCHCNRALSPFFRQEIPEIPYRSKSPRKLFNPYAWRW
jgi:hypothetical protein